jgi:two-component system, NarL family, response regulator
MTPPIRILCVDDHAIVLEGIAAILSRYEDLDLVATATNGEEAIAEFTRHHPDVSLIDLQMPTMSGFEIIRAIRTIEPTARVVVLTMYHGEEDIKRAASAGAAAYLLKDTLADNLIRVIRDVAARPTTEAPHKRVSRSTLSAREEEVVRLVARGMRNKEIAPALGISEGTVDAHLKRIYAKLGVNDRTAALAAAIERGIIHVE